MPLGLCVKCVPHRLIMSPTAELRPRCRYAVCSSIGCQNESHVRLGAMPRALAVVDYRRYRVSVAIDCRCFHCVVRPPLARWRCLAASATRFYYFFLVDVFFFFFLYKKKKMCYSVLSALDLVIRAKRPPTATSLTVADTIQESLVMIPAASPTTPLACVLKLNEWSAILIVSIYIYLEK